MWIEVEADVVAIDLLSGKLNVTVVEMVSHMCVET
jgi:hypothetical protein